MNPDSPRLPREISLRAKAAVSALLALLLVVAGALTAPVAVAAGPSLSAPAVPRAGGTITVTGAGFAAASPGVYLGVGPAGLDGFYAGSSQMTDYVWIGPGNAEGGAGTDRTAPLGVDGTFSVTMTVPAHTDGAQYALYASKAHNQGQADLSQNATAALSWEAAAPVSTTTSLAVSPAGSSAAGTDYTLSATVSPSAAGTVTYFRDGVSVGSAPVGTAVTDRVASASTVSLTATFVPADPSAYAGSTSAAVSYSITAPAPTSPTVTVSKTTGLDRAGETITITGSGFLPNAPSTNGTRRPLSGVFGGAYVAFGKFLDTWEYSADAPSSARKVLSQKWAVLEADLPAIGGADAGGIVLGPDGTFQTTLTVSTNEANDLLAGNYGIYTYAGSGASYAPFETYTPLAFAPVPTVTVSKTTGIDPAGETVTVRGTGFLPAAPGTDGTRPPLRGSFAGTYVAFGSFPETWRPSAGVPLSSRKTFDTKWAVPADKMTTIGGEAAGAIELTPAGTFETTLTLREAEGALADGKWGVYTYSGSGAAYAGFETFTPIAFTGVTPAPPVTPVDPAPASPTTAGSLSWAISSSFSSYITGSVAKGAISVSGGATRSNGVFQFGQSAGSTYSAETGTGTVSYAGAVRFTGHGGALDVTIADPQVRITSAGSAAVYVTHGGSQVPFADLDLAAASRISSGGVVTYVGAPAALTPTGRNQVLQGNSTTLDRVTFTVGAAGAAPAGSTGTVAASRSAAIPPTPPATDGIELDATALAALGSGEAVEVAVAGYQPNESGIKVVVYSTPTLLAEVSADASGVATWAGSLPATLPDGEHALTFQGTVDRGIRFTLARGAQALDGCVVESATLRWGFKESFRTYIEGVGGGGWELDDIVYEYPEFVWSGGTGTVDAETRTGVVAYGGSLRFSGHHGVLDTTLANARIELAGDTGYLVFDVTGTTQTGQPVEQAGVRFAEFALPDLERTDEGLVLDALPATLTEAGALAFGTYAAGETLDAVTAVMPTAEECEAAPVSDGQAAAAEASTTTAVAAEPAPVWPWIGGGAVLVLALAGLGWLVVSRRRASHAE